MIRSIRNVVLAAVALFMPLYIWRMYYPHSDWAILVFLPLAGMFFLGYLSLAAAIYRARWGLALVPNSPLARILTGKVGATCRAVLFLLVSTILLAWQSLVCSFQEIIILVILCFVSSGLFIFLQSRLSSHFHQPFANAVAVSSGTWITAGVFIPVLAWFNWNFMSYSGDISAVDLRDAVLNALQDLPPRRGFIAELLSPMYAYEAAKLWSVVHFGNSRWWTVLFSIDTALVGFIVARTNIILVLFVQNVRGERSFNKPTDGEGEHLDSEGDRENETATRLVSTESNKVASHFFWGTIVTLAIAILVLKLIISAEYPEPSTQQVQSAETAAETTASVYEMPMTTLERILSDATAIAEEIVLPHIDSVLEDVYLPVYKAIPLYADFHYSVLGEYTELTEAARGQMSEALYERLFNGFEERLSGAVGLLDIRFVEAYRNAVKEKFESEIPPDQRTLPVGELTQTVLKGALDRVEITFPLATVAAGIVGSGTAKVVAATVANKMALKVAAKATAKGVAKGGSALVGAGGGAALCAWGGPLAAVCGVLGGVAAWFLTDAVVVNIDEYYNRDEFESELKELIDEDRAQMRKRIEEALAQKAALMNEKTKETLADFKLKDLPLKKDESTVD